MRQYAWYSPEIDTIILQTIVDDCYIAFEWDWTDMIDATEYAELNYATLRNDLTEYFLWFPIGEI